MAPRLPRHGARGYGLSEFVEVRDDGAAIFGALTDAGRAFRTRLLDRLVATTPLPTLTAREQQQLGDLLSKLAAGG